MLAATRVAAREDTTAALVMLHGIYGRGRNWQGIARAVVTARPEYACWLVDLPHHGDSPAGSHGDSVAGLAPDVTDWLASGVDSTRTRSLDTRMAARSRWPWQRRRATRHLQIWVIDSTPEVKSPSGSAWVDA